MSSINSPGDEGGEEEKRKYLYHLLKLQTPLSKEKRKRGMESVRVYL